jgi:shikimate dehydrogenase
MPARGRAAVLGSPVGHSLSPVLHRAAYAALGLHGWTYQAYECREDELAQRVATSAPDVVGYSCTMPLKRAVLEVADLVSELATGIGAGNTLVRHEAGWLADNTDWIGIREALAEAGAAADGVVCLLGAGGTAQAALAALPRATEVVVGLREPSRSVELAAAAERLRRPVRIERLDRIEAALSAADLVISTLPAGAADPFADRPWRRDQTVLDVLYHPWPTRLAATAGAAGARVIGGATMLLHQAAAQVELMTGRAAPVPAMRAALQEALSQR